MKIDPNKKMYGVSRECPVCGSEEPDPTHNKVVWFSDAGTPGLYGTCMNCGVVYQVVHRTKEDTEAYYETGAYRGQTVFLDEDETRLQTLRAKNLLTVTDDLEPPKSVLDFGCSKGTLLAALRDKFGCEVAGVELDPLFRPEAEAKGIPVTKHLSDNDKQYDWLMCIHVLEHLTNVPDTLAEFKEHLNPGGLLIVEVPLLDETYQSYGFSHLSCFTAETVAKAIVWAGFEPVKLVVYSAKYILAVGRKP